MVRGQRMINEHNKSAFVFVRVHVQKVAPFYNSNVIIEVCHYKGKPRKESKEGKK